MLQEASAALVIGMLRLHPKLKISLNLSHIGDFCDIEVYNISYCPALTELLEMDPVGIEPTTPRLKAGCSAD